MLALVMSAPPSELIAQFRQNGMLVVGAAENVVRFLPPLTISKQELSEAIEKTSISLKSFYQESEK
jgi:acetylornithine/N-succinyldiaminopimelate aminotransferase